MKKSKLVGLIKEGRSTREIAKEVDLGQTTVRYWLKKYGLKTNVDLSSKCLQATGKTRNGLSYYCFKCGEKNVEKFYGKKRNICSTCHNQDVIKRGRKKIERAVKYLGGKCVECGYDKHICSLDFHHKDPTQKSKNFSSKQGWSWERLKEEIDKCELLCKNCHAVLHAGTTGRSSV